jgi:hypothetical protein
VEFLSSLEWFCFDRSAVLNVTQWTVLVARLEVCEVFSTAIRIEFKYQLVVGMFISKEKKKFILLKRISKRCTLDLGSVEKM